MTRRAALLVGVLLAWMPLVASACAVPGWQSSAVAEVVNLTNAFRMGERLQTLDLTTELSRAAQAHACDMAETGDFSHTGSGGSSVADRVTRAGYRWRFVAENLAFGQRDAAEAMAGWRGSPPHRQNLVSRDAREIGIGIALSPAGRPYWVMVLARPR